MRPFTLLPLLMSPKNARVANALTDEFFIRSHQEQLTYQDAHFALGFKDPSFLFSKIL
jgi:hypothetical protein